MYLITACPVDGVGIQEMLPVNRHDKMLRLQCRISGTKMDILSIRWMFGSGQRSINLYNVRTIPFAFPSCER